MEDWEKLASNFLKAELKKKGVTYEDVCERLKKIGVEETSTSFRTKISRGKFSVVFMLQVAKALNIHNLHLDDLFKSKTAKTAPSSNKQD